MHNPESVMENEMHKILWDFETQTDHLILARRPDQVIVNKKKPCWIVDLAVPADYRVKLKQSEKWDKYLNFARELKKTMEHEGDGDTNCIWCTWNNPQRLVKGAERLGNKRTSGDNSDYSIIKIGQNTEKSPGNLKKRAVSEKPSANTGVKNS